MENLCPSCAKAHDTSTAAWGWGVLVGVLTLGVTLGALSLIEGELGKAWSLHSALFLTNCAAY